MTHDPGTRSPCGHGASSLALAAAAFLVPLAAADLPRLHVASRFLVDEAGQKVTLRGCNLGCWLLIEPWMLGIKDEGIRDEYSFTTALESRFGADRTAQLLELYRQNWITPREMDVARSFGFNVVRVPFHYGLLMDDARPLTLRPDAFKWLDRAVDLAEHAGLYVILDLHAAPGGQSVDGTTGRADQNKLFDSPAHQEQTAWLWQRIAERYRDRVAVVAYDVLNEPWGDFRMDVREKLLPLIDRIRTAIRAADPDKLIFAPGSLRGIAFYGNLHEHGWKNVGLTEHFYPGLFGQGSASLETHARFLAYAVPAKRRIIERLDVPYLLGEFNPVFGRVAQPELLRRYFDEFGAAGWLATVWSLRTISLEGGLQPDHWCLVTNAEPFKLPDLRTAPYEAFEKAFVQLGTMKLAADEGLRTALTSNDGGALRLATFAPQPAAAPADKLPGWTGVDVSAMPPGGAEVHADGTVTIYGGGSDIWGNHDEFRYVYREMAGDFAIQTWLTSLAVPNSFAKAGWMLRESTAPDAAHVLVHAFADGRAMLAWRSHQGEVTHEQTLAIGGLPVGLGLERTGGALSVRYTDADGRWQKQRVPEDVRLPEKALLGLVVLSHDETTLATATFSGLDDKSTPPPGSLPAADNLLKNPSFETVSDAPNAADRAQHWERWGQWFNREQDWKPQRDGRGLLGYHHWQIESADNSGTYQDVPGLAAGTRCTFSVYANRDLPADGKYGPDTVELRIESSYKGRLLTVASQTYAAKDLASGDNWSRLHVAGTLPADNARVLIVVNPSRQTPRDAALKFDVAALCAEPRADTPVTVSSHSKPQSQEKKEERHE
jgi:hypothetical protein